LIIAYGLDAPNRKMGVGNYLLRRSTK